MVDGVVAFDSVVMPMGRIVDIAFGGVVAFDGAVLPVGRSVDITFDGVVTFDGVAMPVGHDVEAFDSVVAFGGAIDEAALEGMIDEG